MRPPADLLRYQRTVNRGSANRWDGFASHRERVMALLVDAARPAGPDPASPPDPTPDLAGTLAGPHAGSEAGTLAGTLAILGAGNCNDVDLMVLAEHFRTIHLVDLDDEALQRARDRQPAEVAARLVLRAGVDLTGGLALLEAARNARRPPDPAAVAAAALANLQGALPGTFDVVVSACLLSQIAQSCRLALGVEHPHLHELAEAVAAAHLRALVLLARPGGTALLVTDVASSETYPLEETAASQPLSRLLDHLEATDNVFTGTRPRALRRFFARDPVAAPLLALPPRVIEPWLWRLGDDLSLLTYALVLGRQQDVSREGRPGGGGA